MKRKLSKQSIKLYFQQYQSIYIFIGVLFLMGVIFGSVFVNNLSLSKKEKLFYYLIYYFNQVSTGKVINKTEIFKSSFWQNIQLLGLIWILGISMIGFPIVFILLFLKGIIIGFTVGFLLSEMGMNGIAIVFASIFPQNILFIPIYLFLAASSIGLSMKLIRKVLMRQGFSTKFRPIFSQYIVSYLFVIQIVCLAAVVEAYVSTFF